MSGRSDMSLVFARRTPAVPLPPPPRVGPSGPEMVAATLAAGVIGGSAKEWTAADAVALWREVLAELSRKEEQTR